PTAHALEVGAFVHDGPDGAELAVTLSWPHGVLTEEAVRDIAERWFAALDALAAYAARPDAGGLTPSDVPLAAVSQPLLDRIAAEHPGTVDVLPLSPLQEGLLFHALYQREEGTDDLYTSLTSLDLRGPLERPALRRAVDAVVNRHSALRSGFTAIGEHPLQLVADTVTVPWTEHDLTALPADRRDAAVAGIEDEEASRRFDLARPPLVRCALVTLGADHHRLVLTRHHIVMDGWSTPVLLRELVTAYGDGGASAALPATTPYADHLGWLAARDAGADTLAWREALAVLEAPTLHADTLGRPAGGPAAAGAEIHLPLSAELAAALTGTARAHGLTLNTLVQGAWAILLGRLTGRADVVFGATVSGRPGDLPGVESMVGLFSNTVPVRFRPEEDEPAVEALTRLQAQQSALLDHQYLGLADIQALAGHGTLFDTLLVFENYPVDPDRLTARGLRVAGIGNRGATHYPLT
ncbi:condensation domain-containing protein, partial [Kitasatospora sp. NPDC058263]